jgi:hypothetical protein
MGTKKDHEKNSSIYQAYRDKTGLTREAASEKMEYEHNYILDANRLYKIEKGKVTVPNHLRNRQCLKQSGKAEEPPH